MSYYSVDNEGRVVRINYNNATRDSVLDLPLDKVQLFYTSLKAYVELMTQPENMVTYTMQPGERERERENVCVHVYSFFGANCVNSKNVRKIGWWFG